MSQLNVDNIRNRTGSNGGPNFPSGITVAVGQTAYIHGNLQVDGTETIINTETLNVSDKTVGIGSTSNASNTTADGAGIEVFASSSQTGNNKTLTWQNSSSAWTFGGGGIVATDAVVGSAVTINSSGIKAGIITATTFKGDGSQLTGIDATAIQTGNTSVQTVDTGSDGHVKMTTEGGERVRVGPAGQIGLGGANYGSSGQLLTSGGSGAAPTWSTVSSAPEITATASGAISAANKPVISTADNKVTEVAMTNQPNTNITLGGNNSVYGTGGNDPKHSIQVWDSNAEKGVTFGMNGTTLKMQTYTISSTGVPTYYTVETVASGIETQVGNFAACFDSTNNRFIVVYRYSSNGETKAKTGALQSDNSITWGAQTGNLGTNWNHMDMVWDPVGERCILIANEIGLVGLKSTVGTVSGTNISFATAQDPMSFACEYNRLVYCGSGIVAASVQRDSSGHSNNNWCWVLIGTINASAGTIAWTDVTIKTAAVSYPQVAWDSNRSRLLVSYQDGAMGASANFKSKVGTIASGAITLGSEVTIIGDTNLTMEYADTIYDTWSQRIQFCYKNGNRILTTTGTIASSGNSVSWVTDTTLENTQNTWLGRAASVSSGFMAIGYDNPAANQYRLLICTTTSSQTNLNCKNFLGYSKAACADGATATIKVTGNTATLSGMTSGLKYYVNDDATLTTSEVVGSCNQYDNRYAGRAITDTTLLIKG